MACDRRVAEATIGSNLADERIAQLPWGAHTRARSGPPDRSSRGRRDRGCHLCGASYGGGLDSGCTGGPRCPRHHGFRRRDVVWLGGFWVPGSLAQRWMALDAEAASDSSAQPAPAVTVTRPPEPSIPMPQLFKPPPSAAQMAEYDSRHTPRVAKPPPKLPPYKAPPMCREPGAKGPPPRRPDSSVAGPPRQTAQPIGKSSDRSRSPGGFTGERAGVFLAPSSDEEVVVYVGETDGSSPMPSASPASCDVSERHVAGELSNETSAAEERRKLREERGAASAQPDKR